MDTQIKKELDEITGAILDAVQTERIYLFGSHAYGMPHKDSDFDLYVVIPDNSLRPLVAMQEIGYALLRLRRRPVDVLVGTKSKFEQQRELPTLENTVYYKGVLLYGEQRLS